MEKGNSFQVFALVISVGSLIVSLYSYLSQEEGRAIQKEIDKLRLADMRSKVATYGTLTPNATV